jgi:ATPase subunit of ABC transporter with duplicated ATPase domains
MSTIASRGEIIRASAAPGTPNTTDRQCAIDARVTGPNGAGKSRLIDALLGRVLPTSGRASLGTAIMIGEVHQARSRFRGEQPLLDVTSCCYPERNGHRSICPMIR